MAIKHVFFDLDHTLWDFETNSQKAYAKCFNMYQINTDFDVFMSKYRPINERYWKWYREEKVTKEELKHGRLKDVFDAVNYPVSDDLINKIAEDYLNILPEFNQLFDGAFEVLDYLKEKYSLHIITNGFEEIQTHKMEQSGLNQYFDQLITSESVGVKKPNPKVFHYALKRANAKIQESIMIGDSLEADVLGALAVGFDAIHFNPFDNNKENNGIKSISSLLELTDYL